MNLGGEVIEMTKKFKFLGSYITPEGESHTDIKARIVMAKSAANSMKSVWQAKDITLPLKVKLAKTLIWSFALYACETWTLKKQEERMIEAMEMWLWRRVLGVNWTERRTNEWVRQQVTVEKHQGMLAEVRRRKIRKYGHWKRRGESVVLATVGETESRGRRGRRRMEWMSNIIEWEEGLEEAHRHARERRSTAR